jgi:hypothetical protein
MERGDMVPFGLAVLAKVYPGTDEVRWSDVPHVKRGVLVGLLG